MSRHDGNVSLAAAALGISRPALYRRMSKYGGHWHRRCRTTSVIRSRHASDRDSRTGATPVRVHRAVLHARTASAPSDRSAAHCR
ncbi:MAG: helix-turn-helix domain-containing protein [Steroidobacteraceae bacterium]